MDMLERPLRVQQKQITIGHARAHAIVHDGDGRLYLPLRQHH